MSKKKKGSAIQPCPLEQGTIIVKVKTEGTNKAIKDVKVSLSGPKPGSSKTDKLGHATFKKDRDPGRYNITVTFPKSLKHYNYASNNSSVENALTQELYLPKTATKIMTINAYPTGSLEVKLFYNDTNDKKKSIKHDLLNATSIEAVGPKTVQIESPGTHKHTFERVKIGDYTVTAKVPENQYVSSSKSADSVVNVKEKKTGKCIIGFKSGTEVEPKIEVEYKVVVLDRKLSDHQNSTDPKKYIADPTYIQISAQQTNPNPKFSKGAKLKVTPANVEVYTNKTCLLSDKLDLNQPIPNNKLIDTQPYKLWLKAKTKGKFELSLDLEDPGDSKIVKKGPAKESMGVVEMQLKVHQHDTAAVANLKVDPDAGSISDYHTALKDKVIPVQKVLTDQQKVKNGRLLHLQNTGSHGRAKIELDKLVSEQWPADTDDYKITINPTNHAGSIKIFDAEEAGNELTFPAGPSFTVAQLKASKKTLWVEGLSNSDVSKFVQLDLTLNRPDGGLVKEIKRYADWANFKVVQIDQVKLNYTAPINLANAWDSANNRFFINLKTGNDGRKITFSAKLSEEIEGIVIHFMLVEDKNNRKTANWGVDLPDSANQRWVWKDITKDVKHLDKDDRKNLLHYSVKTNNKGYAEKEVILSQFGGDIFHLAAYIDQDPHLAKYIDGHTDLSTRKPIIASEHIQVWRKFWYHEVKVAGINIAGFGNAADAYSEVKVVMEAAPAIEMPRVTANIISPQVIYPKHMLSFYRDTNTNRYVNNYPGDTGDGFAVGDANESDFFSLVNPDNTMPVKIPILNANALWVADGDSSNKNTNWIETTDPLLTHNVTSNHYSLDLETNKKLIDPPLQSGTLFKSGQWIAEDWDPAANSGAGAWGNSRRHNLSTGDISLDPNRNSPRKLKLTLPAGFVVAAGPGTKTRVRISRLKVRGAVTYLGTSYPDGIVNAYTPNDVQDFINTINHELGHSLKQVAKVHPAGIPVHPLQYDSQGSHCNYQNKSCLMYESGPQPAALNKYCPICHPHVLVQDMTSV